MVDQVYIVKRRLAVSGRFSPGGGSLSLPGSRFLLFLVAVSLLLAGCGVPATGEPAQPQATDQFDRAAGDQFKPAGLTPAPPDSRTPEPGALATPTSRAEEDSSVDRAEPDELAGPGDIDPVDEMALPYYAQSGDTLPVVAMRYAVSPGEISSPDPLPPHGLLQPGQLLVLPSSADPLDSFQPLLPDSEVVYSPSALDFDAGAYLVGAGGYLSQNPEYLRSTGWTDPGVIVERVALENSINPRLLISLLEYSCGCVIGQGGEHLDEGFFFGVEDYRWKGLYGQLAWAAQQLSLGYYGWRDGSLLGIPLPDGIIYRPAPDSNAGSVALQYYFSQLWAAHELAAAQAPGTEPGFDRSSWELALDPERGLPALHRTMFGDPWARADLVEPLLPAGLAQPELILPFEPDTLWVYASGPHPAWGKGGALAALDFAPATHATGCVESNAWVLAVADGPVVRSGYGAVVQDLDHDGQYSAGSDWHEQTGWSIFYMHIAEEGRVEPGTYLRTGDPVGHPSCEGGPATGTHLHIARKYNGEWILAGEPLPFVLDGWTVRYGDQPYEGTLVRGDQVITADPWATRKSHITRQIEE